LQGGVGSIFKALDGQASGWSAKFYQSNDVCRQHVAHVCVAKSIVGKRNEKCNNDCKYEYKYSNSNYSNYVNYVTSSFSSTGLSAGHWQWQWKWCCIFIIIKFFFFFVNVAFVKFRSIENDAVGS
jgi:hypothetical protein